jgi:hypothetical protein
MSKCFNHNDAQAIAECRVCGKNICDECAIDLGDGGCEGFACCSLCEKKARALIHKEKLRARIHVFGFLGITVALTLALPFPLIGHMSPLPLLFYVIISAGLVVICFGFVYAFAWHIYMRIRRGAPFRIGDRVAVTDGPHSGAGGEVLRVGDRFSVVVALELDGQLPIYHFDWNQIRKIKKKRTQSEKSVSPPHNVPSVL